ncbi:MAG: hypothetical protein DYG89_00425 [Caldilinea sp. CFX5]|nr:hypothetical protein [Caldilinea sp. CFX5]
MRKLLSVAGALVMLLLFTAQTSYGQSCVPYPAPATRFGFNVARENGRTIQDYNVAALHSHWYLDYATQQTPPHTADMVYAQMIRPPFWKSGAFTKTVEAIIQNNPGALWIVGNEPERDKQDSQTAGAYADFYYRVYHFLKARDPNAHVAIAGVVQSTPLRRRYLDLVLTEYQNRYGAAMPIDVWTLHAFILPENNVWGASIPLGLEAFANEGMQYTITDHDNMTIFKDNIIAFRQWMAARGYRDKPLLITEYGILLSPAHGFPYAKVKNFMLASFDFFLTSADPAIGYPADNNRLVQAWSWFSLNYPPYDEATEVGFNGNLVAPDTGVIQPLGQDYGAYVNKLTSQQALTLTVPTVQITPAIVVMTATMTTTPPINFSATIANEGNVNACEVTMRLAYQDPQGKETNVTQQTLATLAPTTAADSGQTFTYTWQPATLPLGLHKFILTIAADNSNTGLATTQVRQEYGFLVVNTPLDQGLFLPLAHR